MFEGKGALTKLDGSSYVGDFVRDQFEGNGTLIRSNGEKYVGEFKNGKLHGNGTYTWPNGNVLEGIWSFNRDGNPELIRPVIYTKKNGDIYQGYWKNGKPTGPGKMTHPDGTSKEGIWIDGQYTEYPQLKVTKSALNDCIDVFSMEEIKNGDIIVLHNPKIKVEQDMFEVDTTIGSPFTIQNTRKICPYIFLKSEFDKYDDDKRKNPTTREPMTKENCKTYVLHIVDESKSKSPEKSKSPKRKSRTSEKSKRKTRSMSWGGKRYTNRRKN